MPSTGAVGTAMVAAHFEDLIFRRGRWVLWERAQQCTCWNTSSGQPLATCKACGGNGYLYDPPIQSHFILVMSMDLNKQFTDIGEFQTGDCIATVPYRTKAIDPVTGIISYPENPLYEIGEWDKITLLDSEFKSTDTLIKGQSLYGKKPDTLYHSHIVRVLRVLQANPDTGEVTVYNQETDFALDGNTITWLQGGKAPTDGSQYSVMYLHRPVYIVYTQLPQVRDQDGQHFPKKVALRYKGVGA
jgi:hypothetical protein